MTSQVEHVEQLQDMIRSGRTVRVRGGGTKSAATPHDVSVAGWRGITEYTADECVFTARAGTPLRDISAALLAHRQYLPFDPPFEQDGATIGGTVAAGVSGPRRYRYGGVRDFLIGVRLVDGEGRLIRSGGKVVKNAAGFLLHHGVVGSGGRFGILTEVTFKVFPAPEARRTVVADCGDVETAWRQARAVENLRADCEAIDFDESGRLAVTIAGRDAAIEQRAERLAAALGSRPVPRVGDRPSDGGLSPNPGTGLTLVKVAGLMPSWQKLRGHVSAAHFMCAGAVAWLTTVDVERLAAALAEAQLAGQVIRGPHAGDRIGYIIHNEFEERVRRVLDPHDLFLNAAPNSR